MGEVSIRQYIREVLEQKVPPGSIWQHFKGGLYQVVTLACSEENPDEVRVIYRSINTGYVWSRTINDWNSPTTGGVQRFKRLSLLLGLAKKFKATFSK